MRRGEQVIEPTLSELTADEDDYLDRHVSELRLRHADDAAIFAAFRPTSPTLNDFRAALTGTDDEFVEVATRMVGSLASTMRASPKAKEDCVVALVTTPTEEGGDATTVTFLKLDARIEAARLQRAQRGGGIRLQVFKDLLPAPGDMQKGISWPDPRHPKSELILHDTNRGDAAIYFSNAFGLKVSSRALDTENALANELVRQLGPAAAQRAVGLVNRDGGRADVVVARIKEEFPEFEPTTRPLGAAGALPGVVRPTHLGERKILFQADGIELRVPMSKLDAVSTTPDGAQFVTTIRTTSPLTPVAVDQGDG